MHEDTYRKTCNAHTHRSWGRNSGPAVAECLHCYPPVFALPRRRDRFNLWNELINCWHFGICNAAKSHLQPPNEHLQKALCRCCDRNRQAAAGIERNQYAFCLICLKSPKRGAGLFTERRKCHNMASGSGPEHLKD